MFIESGYNVQEFAETKQKKKDEGNFIHFFTREVGS